MHTLTRYVTGDARVLALAGDLVHLVDEDDTALCFLQIVVGILQEAYEERLYVFSYVTCFCQGSCIHNSKWHFQQFGNRAGKESLTRTRRTYEQDIALLYLYAVVILGLEDTLVVVIYRNRQVALGFVLSDHVLVEEGLDIGWLGQRSQLESFYMAFFLLLDLILLDDSVTCLHTLVADIYARNLRGEQLLHLTSTERTFLLFLISHFVWCYILCPVSGVR